MNHRRAVARAVMCVGLAVSGFAGPLAPAAQARVPAEVPLLVNCHALGMAEVFATVGCGWCGATESGIRGTGWGPLEPCPLPTYRYTQPRQTPG